MQIFCENIVAFQLSLPITLHYSVASVNKLFTCQYRGLKSSTICFFQYNYD